MRIHIPYGKLLKKYLPRTLFWRALMIIIVPTMLLQIIVCFIFLDRHWRAVGARLAMAVAGEINMIAARFEDLRGTSSTEDIQDQLNKLAEATGFRILYQPNTDFTPHQHGAIGRWIDVSPILVEKLHENLDYDFAVGTHPRNTKWAQVRVDVKQGDVLVVELPEYRLFSSTAYIFMLWMLGSSLVLFTIAVLFMRNQVRPIRRLSVAVERFGKGADVPSFRPEGALEVRQAGAAFIKMRERLKRQIEQRTTMLAGISHDLRTPVTRMKIEVEMLEDRDVASGLKSDLDAMEKMLEGYLSFARGQAEEKSEIVYLDHFLTQIVENMRRQGEDVICDLEGLPHLKCRAKPIALSRAIENIIANSCKYGDKAEVTLRQVENKEGHTSAEICIEDNGPGIPEEDYENVFKPFNRLEKSRNPETGGIGLGLSIAQDIIHAHGGWVSLGPRHDGDSGLSVIVRLPI